MYFSYWYVCLMMICTFDLDMYFQYWYVFLILICILISSRISDIELFQLAAKGPDLAHHPPFLNMRTLSHKHFLQTLSILQTFTFSQTLSLSHKHFLQTLSLSHTFTLSQTQTISLFHKHFHFLTNTFYKHFHFLTLSLSHKHKQFHFLTNTFTSSQTLSLSHTFTFSQTQTISLSHKHFYFLKKPTSHILQHCLLQLNSLMSMCYVHTLTFPTTPLFLTPYFFSLQICKLSQNFPHCHHHLNTFTPCFSSPLFSPTINSWQIGPNFPLLQGIQLSSSLLLQYVYLRIFLPSILSSSEGWWISENCSTIFSPFDLKYRIPKDRKKNILVQSTERMCEMCFQRKERIMHFDLFLINFLSILFAWAQN